MCMCIYTVCIHTHVYLCTHIRVFIYVPPAENQVDRNRYKSRDLEFFVGNTSDFFPDIF